MSKTTWTPRKIVAELHDRGMTLDALARLNHINPVTFRAVTSRTVRKAEAAISTFLKIPVDELFPDRYPIKRHRVLSSEYTKALESQKAPPASNAEREAA